MRSRHLSTLFCCIFMAVDNCQGKKKKRNLLEFYQKIMLAEDN